MKDSVINTLPKSLANLVLTSFPKAQQISCGFVQSTTENFRKEGKNFITVDYTNLLYFESQNFGWCCGSQILHNFMGSGSPKFIESYFREWISLTNIPHFAILVQYIRNDRWTWKNSVYEPISSCGTLINKGRNPLYENHLLLMYEFYNPESSEFMNDLKPILRSI